MLAILGFGWTMQAIPLLLGLFQSPAVVADGAWWNQAEHLTLSGAMVIAIVILWKSFQAKDAMLVDSAKAVTQALAASAQSNIELRAIIKESVAAKQALTQEIELLRLSFRKFPCIISPADEPPTGRR